MNQPAEQFLTSAKTMVTDFSNAAATSFAGFEKFVELNMGTVKSAMADAAEQMEAAFSAKAPQGLAALTGQFQSIAEKAAAYGQAVAGIVAETGAALSKSTEGKFADAQAQAVASIEAAMKYAPAGSESAVTVFKSAIAAGQNAFEIAQASTKQAVVAGEKNLATATDMVVKTTKSAAK